MRRLAILGGSSPFTAGLIDDLAARGVRLPAHELIVQGRNERHLALVRRYAARRLEPLGWTARQETLPQEAVRGADVILHQPRYGGLELREEGESLCERHGVLADETLGPAALLCAMRTRPAVAAMAAMLRREAPDAWILNLTNPLSLVTGWMAEAGLRCLGLCELPVVTMREVADVLDLPLDSITWQYVGLNHRGFLYGITHDGQDMLEALTSRLGSRRLGGIPASTIARLGAAPLKYFRWFGQRGETAEPRARRLCDLRERIAAELEESCDAVPSSLGQRYMDWYPDAVVPAIEALGTARYLTTTVNVLEGDIVREVKATISEAGMAPEDDSAPPPAVADWIGTFETHERAARAAVEDPAPELVERALALDPTVPRDRVARITGDLCARTVLQ